MTRFKGLQARFFPAMRLESDRVIINTPNEIVEKRRYYTRDLIIYMDLKEMPTEEAFEIEALSRYIAENKDFNAYVYTLIKKRTGET